MILHIARFDDLSARTVYALLKLRTDVFVVEQACAYPELDGRDTEPGTRHLWLAPPDQPADPLAYLRLLTEPDGVRRIGRVCTAAGHRGAGLSGQLMAAALAAVPALPPLPSDGPEPVLLPRPVSAGGSFVLDAQTYLIGFYQRFGFLAAGPEFIEDGIAHTPMRRD